MVLLPTGSLPALTHALGAAQNLPLLLTVCVFLHEAIQVFFETFELLLKDLDHPLDNAHNRMELDAIGLIPAIPGFNFNFCKIEFILCPKTFAPEKEFP